MGIFFARVKTIGAKQGSIVKAAAYRSGEKIERDKTGEVANYTRKQDIITTGIIAPDHAPEWATDRASFWNAVEATEKRKDARYGREVILALPTELPIEDNRLVVESYIRENFTALGMVADFAIHAPESGATGGNDKPDQRNIHAHILLSDRPLTKSGFAKKKNRKWNDDSNVETWRKSWADMLNTAFEVRGLKQRFDHRSYKKQGIDKIAQKHEGKTATSFRRQGKEPDPEQYSEIAKIMEWNELAKEYNQVTEEIRDEQENDKPDTTSEPPRLDIEAVANERLTLDKLLQEDEQPDEAPPAPKTVDPPPDEMNLLELERSTRPGKTPNDKQTSVAEHGTTSIIETELSQLQKDAVHPPEAANDNKRRITKDERSFLEKIKGTFVSFGVLINSKISPIRREKEALKKASMLSKQTGAINSSNPTTVYRAKLMELTKHSTSDAVAKSYKRLDENALECDRRIRQFMQRRGFTNDEIKTAMRRASPALYRQSYKRAEFYARRFNEYARQKRRIERAQEEIKQKKNRQFRRRF